MSNISSETKIVNHLYKRLLDCVKWFLTTEHEANGYEPFSSSQINDFIVTYEPTIINTFDTLLHYSSYEDDPVKFLNTLKTDSILLILYEHLPELLEPELFEPTLLKIQ